MDLAHLCRLALHAGASDLHLRPGSAPAVRVKGNLQPLQGVAPLPADTLAGMLGAALGDAQQARLAARCDCDFGLHVPGVGRFRGNAFRVDGHLGVALRHIASTVPTLAELGMPRAVEALAAESAGLVLVTGAAGSGRSTTLAALVEQINRTAARHVLTLENPVEHDFDLQRSVVSQREVGRDVPDYEEGLRAALRQDVDVVLVAELRSAAEIEAAIEVAEARKLVLAGHAGPDALLCVEGLLEALPADRRAYLRTRLARQLVAVLAQRLVPDTRGGRVTAVEHLRVDGSAQECIRDERRLRELRDHMRRNQGAGGMQTFDQALHRLVSDGRVAEDVALRYATDPDELSLRLSGLLGDGGSDAGA